jgi:hypothetical protein
MSCLQLYVKEVTDGTWDHPICPNFWCSKAISDDDLDNLNLFDHDECDEQNEQNEESQVDEETEELNGLIIKKSVSDMGSALNKLVL